MLTTQHIQEDLSRAYIQAVAAKAGVNVTIGAQAHDYGVDGTFHQVVIRPQKDSHGALRQRRLNSGFNLEFQCKASKDWEEELGTIVYDLEVKTYNDLIFRASNRTATPLVLILMCLPTAEDDWLLLSEDQLLLRKCCYWHRLSGAESDNLNKKRIRFPKTQALTPEAVNVLLLQVEQGVLR
jgi:hypothetical protein